MTTEGAAATDGIDPAVVVTGLRTADDSGLPATGTAAPRLSWRLASDRPGVRQAGYEVQVAASADFGGEAVTSGLVRSSRPLHVPWPAPPLRSSLSAAVASARLYVTALGLHQVAINGHPVSDELLEPGWQSYHHRLLYATYDVTGLLTEGRNAICAAVGDGWYRGKLTWRDLHNVYGDASCLLAQLEIRLTGGGTVTVVTDAQWRASTGALRAADIYDGTDVDLRLEPAGWQRPGFDDSSWPPAAERDVAVRLEQRTMPPDRVVSTRRPAAQPRPDGRLLLDAGQNLTGYLRLRVHGPAGARVRVRHAEVLDGEGRLHTQPLRTARAADTYVLAGTGTVWLEHSGYVGRNETFITAYG